MAAPQEFDKDGRPMKAEEPCEGHEKYTIKGVESAGLRPCPHCGYCPTCGRPQNVPFYPTYPYNPWFYGTWCTGTGGVHTSV